MFSTRFNTWGDENSALEALSAKTRHACAGVCQYVQCPCPCASTEQAYVCSLSSVNLTCLYRNCFSEPRVQIGTKVGTPSWERLLKLNFSWLYRGQEHRHTTRSQNVLFLRLKTTTEKLPDNLQTEQTEHQKRFAWQVYKALRDCRREAHHRGSSAATQWSVIQPAEASLTHVYRPDSASNMINLSFAEVFSYITQLITPNDAI